jgi:uncharacterized repeat protein (TIGR03803 family)
MPQRKALVFLIAVLAVVSGFLTTAVPSFAASKEKVLFSFNGTDGAYPASSLIFDRAGNLYGTTFGGPDDMGAVVELVPGTNGKWSEKVPYGFCSVYRCADGFNPYAELIFDKAGNLYSTTVSGPLGGGDNFGVVFELLRGRNDKWAEKVLFHPTRYEDGVLSQAGLIFDAEGNLYGTASQGGAFGAGTVFQLVPSKNGRWTHKVLHSFGSGGDGSYPLAGLAIDKEGNLYGTTSDGGAHGSGCSGQGCGTVFKLTPGKDGRWTERVLHSFGHGNDGFFPPGGLILDSEGRLYGTTEFGGTALGAGTVFQLTAGTKGKWIETVLHTFHGKDGIAPRAGLIFDAAGNLYSTTEYGGASNQGVVFELSPGTNGKRTLKVLHSFKNDGKDGYIALGGLILDEGGNLYGMTYFGGAHNMGTVFEIIP